MVIVMQRNVARTSRSMFDRTWSEFKAGFGVDDDCSGYYWIGNERLHQLTKDGNYRPVFPSDFVI